jgi:hypothetical protein
LVVGAVATVGISGVSATILRIVGSQSPQAIRREEMLLNDVDHKPGAFRT